MQEEDAGIPKIPAQKTAVTEGNNYHTEESATSSWVYGCCGAENN
ncbi:hypothetical protein VA7868_03219 [Vibrio aerogenes CECT 7868]|uniref:Uncharacterized protein n=1 Tax=Vibrio aerogenes CECT 7868 TaxID=1216006 RepID=A0A1M5ZTR2_9VIBR|nr:hypothetical protein VA7868_03219 [Vibrio aerogenes CECT 7868]